MREENIDLEPGSSIRAEQAFPAISKLHSTTVGCKNCNDGIISTAVRIRTAADVPEIKMKRCECFNKYRMYKKYLIGGIPREFWNFKDIELDINHHTEESVNSYIWNIKDCFNKGLGALIIDEEKGFNCSGKTSIGIKILENASALNYSIHYTNAHDLMRLMHDIRFGSSRELFNEIMGVDFLFIDDIAEIRSSEQYPDFVSHIKKRFSDLQVNIFAVKSGVTIIELFDRSFIETMHRNMIKIDVIQHVAKIKSGRFTTLNNK
jgi:DNA replication protein DnaC